MSQKSSLLPPNLCFMLAMVVVLGSVSSVFAQVTFSRDWNAGKRAFEPVPSDCGAVMRTIVSLCGAISKNAHQLSLCEMKSIFHSLHDDDTSGNLMLHK
ncbi:adipokinetic hormone/corazonin-related peptide-like isoform X1 [Phlebotomus argentipes]|uniref:adipokinetic hormone/corazonin-related peptide-like isoform X1 n=1 Tax=Phlebotomus argentipes TaxID=94469 RepID=UPI00289323DF|nr:adipokinetic hormone/corazonin-related peptide-like isoform X1 [Phlebotomus argentipes]